MTTPDPDIIDAKPDWLTVDEIDTIEEIIDGPFDSLSGPGVRRGRMMRLLAVTVKRRTDPEFRFEDAGSLKIRFGEPAPVPPTGGDGSEPS